MSNINCEPEICELCECIVFNGHGSCRFVHNSPECSRQILRFMRIKLLYPARTVFTNKIFLGIKEYIEYAGEAIDNMNKNELNEDFEVYLSK